MNDRPLALPERPNLEQLRKQARERQRENPGLTLAQAQRELARDYGFSSWGKLKRHVEETLGLRSHLDSFVEAALGGQLDEADAILSANPALKQEPAVAALWGDSSKLLDPRERFGPRDWPALLYVCYSRYHQRPDRRPGLLETARRLLEAGADPDAFYIDATYPEPPETCLYGASGLNNQPELVALLLSYGANATDLEALYHGTEHRDLQCLRLILEAGGNPKGANCVAHMLDYEDPVGLRLVLDHYGEPDEELANAVHHAIIRGRSVEHLRLLRDHGAYLDHLRGGVTPYVRARLVGRRDLADFLEESGASTEMSDALRFVVACIEEDDSVAPVPLPVEVQGALSYAARDGRVGAIRRLLAAGVDPNTHAEWGLSGLHQAGFHGQAEAVRVLVEAGASLAVRDPHHNGTPINWTVAGAAWKINPSGDHLEAARIMLEHGAARHCSPDFVLGLSRELPEMRALLESFGVGQPA